MREPASPLIVTYAACMTVNPALSRGMVSAQANATRGGYNWFPYREGFSASLIEYVLTTLQLRPGRLLDPFAGGGTALFAAAHHGWETHGIDVLPVGPHVIRSRIATDHVSPHEVSQVVQDVLARDFTQEYAPDVNRGGLSKIAYPAPTAHALAAYMAYCTTAISNPWIAEVFQFAAFCILESISYTRKDGQFLRWDHRSGRSVSKTPFEKRTILPFRDAITAKLQQIVADLHCRPANRGGYVVPTVECGSCLDLLPLIASGSVDLILTSPPYCNRYDYTRTYALELDLLGVPSDAIRGLRQSLLSCTIENTSKATALRDAYCRVGRGDDLERIDHVYADQSAFHETLAVLDDRRVAGQLNNPHVVRMVRNYVYEMAVVLFEMERILAPHGVIVMVNDNVRYAGVEIPVDLILSNIASAYGLVVEHIWSLPRGKGNSSQQMKHHGRVELRKSVCVWRKW